MAGASLMEKMTPRERAMTGNEVCQECACVGCSEGNCCDHAAGQWYDNEAERQALEKFLLPIVDDPVREWATQLKEARRAGKGL